MEIKREKYHNEYKQKRKKDRLEWLEQSKFYYNSDNNFVVKLSNS